MKQPTTDLPELTEKHGFSNKASLVGLSRGGLYCYNWATANRAKWGQANCKPMGVRS